ncbi:Ppx/GppA phosphatase family protein [Micromonospora aurantiaca]|uniref:Ppx/GppA family phosphatase n=1 Tax=Micromonospora aurantiaca (nom. illeg.) TaxID=47850 RepID=A0ABQ6UCP9_9ACTN|nr:MULTISPECIES: Ppx/GppA phosphatase family protein [Micromonospora]ADU08346.1 Ppx/GppA phosphatase [Micromonospora sp. L5]KAB1108017.1 Ppx/GppA family phosphatase [Micromonospora aurantiaca]MBC9004860.1 Ppx/GppA family phosphatase [Micromonospora aurantiaca]MDG4754468.1 Ppx/GppA phosphatase family protein [Micromonospora sp. WMMD718]RNH99976.1 Ppx/GppA family phosphatase [Micromonospora aurantiaca]
MRLGVLDVGSNTVHLLVVDAHHGAHPWPAHSEKVVLRLAEQIGPDGALTDGGADGLVKAVGMARAAADGLGAEDLLAFATSAVRDATNAADVLARVRDETGVRLEVLSGADEARMTFLAVRRWFGWSAGRLLAMDIGGGSLELAAGIDEHPDVAISLPLGAGRLSRERLAVDPAGTAPPSAEAVEELRAYVNAQLDPVVEQLTAVGWERPVATSKTFRTLARLAGAAPSGAGLWARRSLTRTGLRQVLGFIRHIPPAQLPELEGVSAQRAHQLLAGAVVAEAVMRRLDVDCVDICPWALREGVILRRLDQLAPM